MDDILNINGVEYIRKAEYDKAKRDVDNIKQLVSSSIAGLSDFLSNQSIAQVSTPEVTEEVEQGIEHCYAKRSKKLRIRVAGQREYKIIEMTDDGYFYSKPYRKLVFDVRDVMKINRQYGSTTTRRDLNRIAKDCQLPIDIVYRIIYNIDQGIFKPYIKQYLSTVNDIKIKAKKVEVQNNPEKRREAGMYM